MSDEQTQRNPMIIDRNNRIQQLLARFKKDHDKTFDENVSQFSLETGVSPKTVRQYARLLEEAKKIVVEQRGNEYYARVLED